MTLPQRDFANVYKIPSSKIQTDYLRIDHPASFIIRMYVVCLQGKKYTHMIL